MDYDKKHPLYGPGLIRRELALDLYEGGKHVEGKSAYLVRHPYESKAQYKIRMERATYRNFTAPIVDVFASFINENRPQRELPTSLSAIEENADRMGMRANPFFAHITRLAAAGGIRFVLIDMEPEVGASIAEAKAAGRRQLPYFVDVNPDDVLDWQIGPDGLDWVVIRSSSIEGNAPFTDGILYETLTVWMPTEWRRYKRIVENGKGGTADWHEDSKGINPTGVVPLVPFIFEAGPDSMTGVAATDDILSLVLRIYRRDSELDKMLFDRAVPLLKVCGMDVKDWETFTVGSSSALMSTEPQGIEAEYVEPTGTSFDAQTSYLTRDENSVREIALRMIRPLSAVGESAESKQIDRQQLDTQLAAFARRCASAEARCWKIAAKWLGLGEAEQGGISTPYTENYDVDATSEAIVTALLSLKGQNVISAATIRQTEAVRKYLPEDWTPEEEEIRLQQETGNMTTNSTMLSLSSALKRGNLNSTQINL